MLKQETEETVEQIEESLGTVLLEVAKQLGQAIRLRGFYPKGHVAVSTSLSKLKEALDSILAGREEITIGSTGESLLFEGMAFGGNKKPAQKLAEWLKVRDISGVTFRSGVQQPELENAVEILSEKPDVFASPDSPLLRPDSQTDHVEFRQIHYDRILRHVSEEEAKSLPSEYMDNIWHSVIQDDLGGGDGPTADQAKAMIEESVQDRTSFKRMAGQLIKASEQYGGDRAAIVAKGVRKTCEWLTDLTDEKKSDGMNFLSEALQNMDPDIVLKLLEKHNPETMTEEQCMVLELTQSLTVNAKLGVLAALVRSQKDDSRRISSVFSRIAGVEKRRQELMKAIEQEASSQSDTRQECFELIWSSVQKLVISETEGEFVGSRYVSMLEALGEEAESSNEDMVEDNEHLNELRKTLAPARMPVAKAIFLTDLAALQDDVQRLSRTLNDIETTCAELHRKGEFETAATITSELSSLLPGTGAVETEKDKALRNCLGNLINDDTGRLVLERMMQEGDSLKVTLDALGGHVCRYVCELAARSDAALCNNTIGDYFHAHPDLVAQTCGETLLGSPATHCRRLLKVLSFLNTTEAVSHMRSALGHQDSSVQAEAIRALAGADTERSHEALQGILDGGDQKLARLAATALGECGSRGAAEVLLESLQKMDKFGRRIPELMHVATTLGSMQHCIAVHQLETLLNKRMWAGSEKKRHLREAVALALARIASDEALSALERGASCRNRGVREVCRKVLESQEERSC